MNLYGENGNIKALSKYLTDQGVPVDVDYKTISDEIDFNDYHFVYVGSGIENVQKLALSHLIDYKDQILNYISKGNVMLFTGNSLEMLGKQIISCDSKVYDGCGVFDFVTKETNQRYTGDVICKYSELEKPLVGFINKCTCIEGPIKNPLFNVDFTTLKGIKPETEGFRLNNLFATYLIGPILAKNPHFGEFITKLILNSAGIDDYKKISYPYAEKAHDITLSNLISVKDNLASK